jgi:hypothetical protein
VKCTKNIFKKCVVQEGFLLTILNEVWKLGKNLKKITLYGNLKKSPNPRIQKSLKFNTTSDTNVARFGLAYQ